jgi:hypothetical protein
LGTGGAGQAEFDRRHGHGRNTEKTTTLKIDFAGHWLSPFQVDGREKTARMYPRCFGYPLQLHADVASGLPDTF